MMNRSGRPRAAGFTLIELVIAMGMTAVLASALAFAMGSALNTQRRAEQRRAEVDRTQSMEQEITRMIEGAQLVPVAGTVTATTPATTTLTYFQGTNDGGQGTENVNRITFTTTAPGIPMQSQYSTDDFETQNQNIGPVGGLAEVSVGMVAVGDGGGQSGLFERIQRPADGDPTQGGNEFVLDPDVTSIGFQFWDGTQWVDSWDTTTGGTSTYHLPEAVQVTYTLKGDTGNTPHLFVVAIPSSDITSTNPYVPGGSATP
ncbi:MAG: type II secretion system protein GspJ [Capsulimonadaceae bacterium]